MANPNPSYGTWSPSGIKAGGGKSNHPADRRSSEDDAYSLSNTFAPVSLLLSRLFQGHNVDLVVTSIPLLAVHPGVRITGHRRPVPV